MEMLTSQGLLISPSVALPVGVTLAHDEVSPPEEALSSPNLMSPQITEHSLPTAASAPSLYTQGTERRKIDAKWNKPTNKSTLPLNLISATNQQKVAQNMPIKQQLPLKLATR